MKRIKKISLSISGCIVIICLTDLAKEPQWLCYLGSFTWGLFVGFTD